MKKTSKFLTVGCAAVLAVGMLLGTGCSDGAFTDDKNAKVLKLTSDEVYAASAVSGAAFLNSVEENKPTRGETTGENNPDKGGENIPTVGETPAKDDERDEIGGYIAEFESVLSGNVGHTITANTDAAYAEYQFVMSISYGKENAKMYYNEAKSVTKIEVADDFDDDDETETITKLTGIAVYGNEEYTVRGVKTVETDGKDEEFSLKFRIIKDEFNFVEFAYEAEKDGKDTEIAYELKVVANGLTVTEYELETETENGATEISYSVKTRDENGVKKYEIKKNDRRENVFFVTVEENGIKTKTILKKTENGYETIIGF